jgi:hypothetical protein
MIDNNRAPLAKSVTTRFADLYLSSQSLFFNLGFNAGSDVTTAGGLAGRSGTQGYTGLPLIPARQDSFP